MPIELPKRSKKNRELKRTDDRGTPKTRRLFVQARISPKMQEVLKSLLLQFSNRFSSVTVLPIPKDLPREERHLLKRATQELLREAAAFIKGRNAKKRANFGYELGANLNSDGTHRQGQTFVESNTQLQSVTSTSLSFGLFFN